MSGSPSKKAKGLPKFEGQEVKARELTVSGTIKAAMGVDEPHSLEDEIVIIGTARVAKIGHERKGDADALTRIESAKAIDLFVVSENVDALTLLQQAKADREKALDELLGREPLPFGDNAQATDDELDKLLREEAEREAADAAGVDPATGEIKPEGSDEEPGSDETPEDGE